MVPCQYSSARTIGSRKLQTNAQSGKLLVQRLLRPRFSYPHPLQDPPKLVSYGTIYNNPSKLLLDEASRLWPHAIQFCLISVGTGRQPPVDVISPPPPKQFLFGSVFNKLRPTPFAKSFLDQLLKLDANAMPNMVHDEVWEIAQQSTNVDLDYYRFNVENGLQDVSLDDWKSVEKIAAVTRSYTSSREISHRIQASVRLFGVRPRTQGSDAGSVESRNTIGDFRSKYRRNDSPVANRIDMGSHMVNTVKNIGETSIFSGHPLLRHRKTIAHVPPGRHGTDDETEGESKNGGSILDHFDPGLESTKDDRNHGINSLRQTLTVENAAELWQQVDAEPRNETCQQALYDCYARGKDYSHCAHGWLRLIERHPGVKSLHSRLWKAYSDGGDYNAAIMAWLCLWEQFPTNLNFLRYLRHACRCAVVDV